MQVGSASRIWLVGPAAYHAVIVQQIKYVNIWHAEGFCGVPPPCLQHLEVGTH